MKAGRKEIEGILPHRDPFVFVDEVESLEDGSIRATRLFRPDEWYFAGHFPQYPVVPGVLLVETLAQAGGVGFKLVEPKARGIFFLATINNVKFRRQVRPGDLFEIQVTTLKGSTKLIKQAGKGFVAGELAVEAEWLCIAASGESMQ
jgi:3-hydroxyacyl-[acyl-carrier-protein] dehydratase